MVASPRRYLNAVPEHRAIEAEKPMAVETVNPESHLSILYEKLTSLVSASAQWQSQQTNEEEAEEPAATPIFWVSKWVDYSDKYGLGYAGLSEVNPGIVVCSLSGYGQDGPYRDVLGHDLNYLSFAGVLDLLGTPSEPGIPLNLVADLGGGALFAAIAVLAARNRRHVTGEVCHVTTSRCETAGG